MMLPGQFVKALPKVDIFQRAFFAFPTVAFPGLQSGSNSVTKVFGIRMQNNITGALERLERAHRGGKFHPVIRCILFRAGHLELFVLVHQNDTPTACPRIRLASAIGKNINFRPHSETVL